MKRKTAGRSAEPRVCARCGGMMPADKPVFLLTLDGGSIVGPYHSGCAWKVARAAKVMAPAKDGSLASQHVYGRVPREETLPW